MNYARTWALNGLILTYLVVSLVSWLGQTKSLAVILSNSNARNSGNGKGGLDALLQNHEHKSSQLGD